MNEIAAPHASVKPRRWLAPIVLLIAAAMLLVGYVSPAKAAPVAKDGRIYACYKVKGKPRGAMRVLFKGKRCRRGERKVAWVAASASGSAGQAGGNGQSGTNGSSGSDGTKGSDGSTDATLNTKIAALELKVDSLEGALDGVTSGDLSGVLSTLDGVTNTDLTNAVDTVKGLTNTDLTGAVGTVEGLTNADLTGAVGTVEGLTNTDLLETVEALPLVAALCDQAAALTAQANLLRGEFGDLVSTLTGSLLGSIFGGVSVPGTVDPFSCATP